MNCRTALLITASPVVCSSETVNLVFTERHDFGPGSISPDGKTSSRRYLVRWGGKKHNYETEQM